MELVPDTYTHTNKFYYLLTRKTFKTTLMVWEIRILMGH